MTHKTKDFTGSWIYIVPTIGLILTDAVKNEITINRVTFISVEKLPRVLKRFGIQKRMSELKSTPEYKSFFSELEVTVALVRFSGKQSEVTTKALRLIVEELEILSVSQLGYSRRRFNSYPSIYISSTTSISYLCLNLENDLFELSYQRIGKIGDLRLDEHWMKWQNDIFFTKLIKIFKNEIVVNSSWRGDLYRASRLIGQSITTNNLAQAFLANMIAIELLLTRQGDKYTEILPKRIEAFIGWIGYWEVDNYKEKIKGAYKKRSQYVHDGDESNILIQDLLLTDEILLNIMVNLVSHHEIFKSKDNVIDFTNKVAAEHVLGIIGNKSKIRPKTLSFLSVSYTKDDFKKI